MRRRRLALLFSPLSITIVCQPARATDLHFDYTSFDNANSPGANPHFGQNQFNVLNYPSLNGNYMMTSTDNHRPEMVANNNALAEFYNNFLADYNTQYRNNGGVIDPIAEADAINSYTVSNSTKNGPKPNWVLLNEISVSVWQDTTQKGIDYRAWVVGVATRLHDTYGFNVVTFAPFATVGTARAADWQLLTAKSYVGVENYLSGQEVMSGGSDYGSRVAWAQAQYQASVDTYGAAGVPKSKLVLTEEFANTTTGTGWGRGGISASDWDTVIQIRQDAIRNVGFPGFAAYAWGSNGMFITEKEQIQHEYWYRTRLVMPGQQPQWLSDAAWTIGDADTPVSLSWSEQLNWLGGVPNAPGAIANFFRTNTAARSITLDGSKTIGTLSFNSSNSYTITPGAGGSITLDNGGSGATVAVPIGSHTISVPLVVNDAANFNVATSLSLTSGLSTTGTARTITKSGAGTLTIAGGQSYLAGSTLSANAGITNLNSSAAGNLTINANATVNFGSSQSLAGLAISSGQTVTLTAGGNKSITTAALNVAGKLNLNDNDLIVRSGTLGTWNGSAYTGITGSIALGYGNGTFNGPAGIVTTQSNATGGTLTSIGVASNADLNFTTFDGVSVGPNDVIAMYTYAGDANLDGMITGDDYFQIDSSVPANARGWFHGDFNYDGVINGDDYFIIDSNFPAQGPSLAGAAIPIAAVPEPVSLMIPLALPLLARRRRRVRRARRA
jgi:hypothetical protein